MTVGTKSILFGVHQFLIHPITVLLAWIWLYRKFPGIRECVCIFIHDWGYLGKSKMDDADGQKHPELAAKIAGFFFGERYRLLCLYHSRHYAKLCGCEPSMLCWADKASIIFDPWFFYLPRAWMSGELFEYRINANDVLIDKSSTHRQWYDAVKKHLLILAKTQRADATIYMTSK